MKKILLGFLALCVASPAIAQVRVPIYQDRNGSYQGADATICLRSDGTECPIGSAADPITVTATSLPLPTGASTAARQDTQTTALQSLVTSMAATGTSSQNVQGAQANAAAVTVNPVLVAGSDGTNVRMIRTDTNGFIISANAGLSINGAVAHDAADSGNPMKIGGYASSTAPTGVAAGDRVNAWYSLNGAAVIAGFNPASGAVYMLADTSGTVNQPYALTAARWQYAAASGGISNTTTAVTVAAAGGASVRNYVTGMQCSASALGAATELAIRDGAAGTVLWRGYVGTAGLMPFSVEFNVPLKGTANTLVEVVTLTASITGAVYCNVQGFTAA